MGWYRRGKLALDRFRSLASRVVPQNPIFQRGLRICQFGKIKCELLPPTLSGSVRVRMIAQNIIDALQRGLRERYASENAVLVEGDESETLSALAGSDEKVEGSWHKEDDKWVQQGPIKDQERGSQAATSHLDRLNWEIFVINKPFANAYYFGGGKIVVTSGFLEHFKSDAEIANVIGHEVLYLCLVLV
ncbi:Mitochondrial metalloendopeptidase OMA1 [Spatholobus suberectus]|nr:Mitochondrial metalloendopeptidase OMA1 [Spatholobus suberectus]